MKSEITRILQQWNHGDPNAMATLLPLVYEELRSVARARMGNERGYHTLEPTALVHEFFFKLAAQNEANMKNRNQFFALAARLMRRILIDHARAKGAKKRGGFRSQLLDPDQPGDLVQVANLEPLLLEDALVYLAELDPKLCKLVELKCFGGFNMGEISDILELPHATAYRHWKLAKAHLFRYFNEVSVGY